MCQVTVGQLAQSSFAHTHLWFPDFPLCPHNLNTCSIQPQRTLSLMLNNLLNVSIARKHLSWWSRQTPNSIWVKPHDVCPQRGMDFTPTSTFLGGVSLCVLLLCMFNFFWMRHKSKDSKVVNKCIKKNHKVARSLPPATQTHTENQHRFYGRAKYKTTNDFH